MSKGKLWVLVLLGAIIAAGAGTYGYYYYQQVQAQNAPPPPARELAVATRTPEVGNVIVAGEFIGSVAPNQQVMVLPKMGGEVKAVYFNVGDAVQAGDILFEVDTTVLETSISQMQAALASGQAKAQMALEMAQQNKDTFDANLKDGNSSNATLAQAKMGAANAKSAVQTANFGLSVARRTLRELRDDDTGMISDAMIDQARDAVTQAELGREAAQTALEKAEEMVEAIEKTIAESAASVDSAVEMARLKTNFNDQYIALNKLKKDLTEAAVAAPVTGVIEQRNVEPFGMAMPSSPAFVISDKNTMVVTFKVPEKAYNAIEIDDLITLEHGDATCRGKVTEIATAVDMASGLFTVKAALINPPADLRTGTMAKVIVDVEKAERTMLLPLGLVYYENNTPYVYVEENGEARKKVITTGLYNNEHIQILSGLSGADKVIETWHPQLAEGVAVVPAQ